ncbi:MAG: TatD family hydrolase [bacterium]
MQLFDAHCHLQDERLRPHLDAAMRRAAAAGVAGFMCCGSSEEDWALLPDMARRFPGVRLSFGLHPWYAGFRSGAWLRTLESALTSHPSAVGEIGLDHALDRATFADQEAVFLAQIHLANTLGRPVSIHCRRAWGRLMELLDETGWPACGFMIHSYSGSPELVEPLIRRGAYLSFSGALTSDRNLRGRTAVAAVPPERLLIETDAPDLAPARSATAMALLLQEGRPVNEPGHLPAVLKAVSDLKTRSIPDTADLTWRNAHALWGTA